MVQARRKDSQPVWTALARKKKTAKRGTTDSTLEWKESATSVAMFGRWQGLNGALETEGEWKQVKETETKKQKMKMMNEKLQG